MKKVFVLTAGFGEGHNAAARNLAAAIDDREGIGSAMIIDLFDRVSPRLNRISKNMYLGMINRTPRIWSACYRGFDRYPPFPKHLWFLHKERRLLKQLISEQSPDAICCTFPVCTFIANELEAKGFYSGPIYNIVTDSISINSLWTRSHCTGWFVPNKETTEELIRQGVPYEKIHDFGFPVPLTFAREIHRLQPPDLHTSRPRILYMLHSGTFQAEETALKLLKETDYSFTFAVGRDEPLRQRLLKATEDRPFPVEVLSWTNRIPELLMTHHLLISKAGGATTQEAIAAQCPMIVNQIVPGQEEGNYELIRQRGAGTLAVGPDAIVQALRNAFANECSIWKQWKEGMKALTRNEAAWKIADHVLTPYNQTQLPPVTAHFFK
jgi:processive 1,2-diacylglycerol beta-glucosyltransferase